MLLDVVGAELFVQHGGILNECQSLTDLVINALDGSSGTTLEVCVVCVCFCHALKSELCSILLFGLSPSTSDLCRLDDWKKCMLG